MQCQRQAWFQCITRPPTTSYKDMHWKNHYYPLLPLLLFKKCIKITVNKEHKRTAKTQDQAQFFFV